MGTPVAARNEVEFENMIGLFVNTLVFRADFQRNITFRELVRQVRPMLWTRIRIRMCHSRSSWRRWSRNVRSTRIRCSR